jgi:pilus assembly protein CpaE
VQDEHIAPVPRISIQAFCASADTAAAMQAASEDRRMTKAHLKVQMGGIAAATEAYRASATPNVVIIESEGRGEELLNGLDSLAEVCDAGTRVLVIGHLNDIVLYREMVRRGVSDYLIAPIGTIDVIRSVSGLFYAADAKPVGRTLAVVGAKGGVGASTVAHNIAWASRGRPSRRRRRPTSTCRSGPPGLDFNQDPPQGIADAVGSPDRIDTGFRRSPALEMHRSPQLCSPRPPRSTRSMTSARGVRLDLRRAARDRAVHRARRAACVDRLGQAHADRRRRHPDRRGARSREPAQHQEPDRPAARRAPERQPPAILPQHGRRAEAARDQAADFAKALEFDPIASIPFEPQLFGTAANNGQMIAEVSSGHRAAETFRTLAQTLTGRTEVKRRAPSLLTPLIEKLTQQGRSPETACSRSVPHRAPTCRRPGFPTAPGGGRARRARRTPEQSGADVGLSPFVRGTRRCIVYLAPARARDTGPSLIIPGTAPRSRRFGILLRGQRARFFSGPDRGDSLVAACAASDAKSAREEIRDIVNEIIAIKSIVMSIASRRSCSTTSATTFSGYWPARAAARRATTSPTSW